MLVLCSLLVALTVNQASPAADQAGRVSGRVTLDGANTPVAGVRIMLMPAGRPTGPMGMPPQAVTDQDGRYVFGRLAPGTYRIDAQKTGFAPIAGGDRAPTLQVAAGQAVDNVDIRLQKGAVLAGRVLDSHGEPLPDARIMVFQRTPATSLPGGLPRLMPAQVQGAQTNDLGEFRAAGLAPGEYFVAAMPQQPAMMFGGPGISVNSAPPGARAARTAIVTTYYPGTNDQAAALPVAVAAGAETGNITFVMQSAPAFHVSGVVVDEEGRPVAGAMVTLTGDPRNGMMFMGPAGAARTQDNGRFDLDDVIAGTYRANAAVPVSMNGRGAAAAGASGRGSSSGVVAGGTGSGGFMTWSSRGNAHGTMTQAVEVTVSDADVSGVRVVVQRPARQ